MAIDLTGAAAIVEGLMDDRCRVFVPGQPTGQLDPVTLKPAAPADVDVYGSAAVPAPFKLKPAGSASQQVSEGSDALDQSEYVVDLPLSAPELPAGSILVVASSLRLPLAVGKRLTIGQPIVKTMAVKASYHATLRVDAGE